MWMQLYFIDDVTNISVMTQIVKIILVEIISHCNISFINILQQERIYKIQICKANIMCYGSKFWVAWTLRTGKGKEIKRRILFSKTIWDTCNMQLFIKRLVLGEFNAVSTIENLKNTFWWVCVSLVLMCNNSLILYCFLVTVKTTLSLS